MAEQLPIVEHVKPRTTLLTPLSCHASKTVTMLKFKLNDEFCYDIDYNPDVYSRKIVHETVGEELTSIEQMIDYQWTLRCSNNKSLFNGSKFRLNSVTVSNKNRQKKYTFNIGLTNYKDYLGTNNCKTVVNEISKRLNSEDKINEEIDLNSYLACPLGCGALVVTSDEKILFIKRSENCGEYPLYYDRPGGYAEPDLCSNLNEINHELFVSSITRELKEELNFDDKFIDNGLIYENRPALMGVILNCETYHTPTFEFLVK